MGDGGKLEKRNPGQDMKGFESSVRLRSLAKVVLAKRPGEKVLKSKCDLVQIGRRTHWRPCSSVGGGG